MFQSNSGLARPRYLKQVCAMFAQLLYISTASGNTCSTLPPQYHHSPHHYNRAFAQKHLTFRTSGETCNCSCPPTPVRSPTVQVFSEYGGGGGALHGVNTAHAAPQRSCREHRSGCIRLPFQTSVVTLISPGRATAAILEIS